MKCDWVIDVGGTVQHRMIGLADEGRRMPRSHSIKMGVATLRCVGMMKPRWRGMETGDWNVDEDDGEKEECVGWRVEEGSDFVR